jgi:signal transduction histidine kinase
VSSLRRRSGESGCSTAHFPEGKGRGGLFRTIGQHDNLNSRRSAGFLRRGPAEPRMKLCSRAWPKRFGGVFAAILALVLFASSAARADVPSSRSVLILDQSAPLRPWASRIIGAVQSSNTDKSGRPISYHVEHLDLFGFGQRQYDDNLRNHLADKYVNKKFDAILSIGPAALDFAIKLRSAAWPEVPVVFAGLSEEAAPHPLPPNTTGIFVYKTFANMVKAARIIVPDLKRLVLVGNPFEGAVYYPQFANEIPEFSKEFEIIDLMGMPVRAIRERVATLTPDSAVFYFGINADAEKKYTTAVEALTPIAEATSRPIIGDADTEVGAGAIGGFDLVTDEVGRDAGRVLLRILDGEEASHIPLTTGHTLRPMFDWRQLQRWHIGENTLPPGSEIRFRPPDIWDRYRAAIVTVIAAVVVQGALISWLLFERRRRRMAEAAARQTMSELLHVNRMATAGELSASIAHEVNQPLAGMVANANAGIRWLAAATPNIDRAEAAFRQIVAAGHHAGDVITSVRGLFKRGAEERCDVQINQLIRNALSLERIAMERRQVSARLELAETLPDILGNRVQLLQVVLNLISNAIESMASSDTRILRITSRVNETGDILVAIEDSGVGIDQQTIVRIFDPLFTTKREGLGIGLSICRSIVENHDGRLWVTSTVGQGSIFFIKLPRFKAGDGWQGRSAST